MKDPIESEISLSSEHDDLPSDQLSPEVSSDDNDYLLALMLQHEYNNEFNGMMKKYETAVNRNSKGKSLELDPWTSSHCSLSLSNHPVKVSMKNFMLLPAARPDQTNAEVTEDIEMEEPRETFSDCEQGTFFPSQAIVSRHSFPPPR